MKKLLSKNKKYFKLENLKNDKRIVVFLACLFIATGLWFLNALSKDYSATISYPVKYINPPQKQFLANNPPSEIELKVSAHGFTLLRNKLNFSFSPIVLNITKITSNIVPSSNGYRINANNLIRNISDQISNEININNIQPEIFFIKLDSLNTKSVPVKADIELNFKPQYSLKNKIVTTPKQVKITGPAVILDTIRFLITEKKLFNKLESDVNTTLKIIIPENTTVTPEEIELQIPVEKFTEKKVSIPIQIKNNPTNTNIKLFPSEIELTVLVGLSEFETINASKFGVFVDYNKINTETKNLEVLIESKPPNIQIIRFSPTNIEYLIETY